MRSLIPVFPVLPNGASDGKAALLAIRRSLLTIRSVINLFSTT